MKLYPQELAASYRIELALEDTVKTVEEKIARARGCLKAGGNLDLNKTIQMILRDFKMGKLGAFSLEKAPGGSAES